MNYRKPPIVECVIGITFAESVDAPLVQHLVNRVKVDYPVYQENFAGDVSVEVDSNGEIRSSGIKNKTKVFSLQSNDSTERIILKNDNFTIGQLAPYPGWDVFFARFKRDWKKLLYSYTNAPIKTVGLRYINRIDLPVVNDVVNHEEYILCFPQVPKIISTIDVYQMHVNCRLADVSSRLLINTCPTASAFPGLGSFILDLDIVRDLDVPQKEEDLYAVLGLLRLKKNELFESMISDKCREIFGHE